MGITDHNDEGVIKIVAAALGSSHTALVSSDGRLWLFGEGAAIAGGDVTRFDDVRGSGDGAGGLKESGGLLRRSQADKSGLDPVTVRAMTQRLSRRLHFTLHTLSLPPELVLYLEWSI